MSVSTAAAAMRPLSADDVDAIIELNVLCDMAETGRADHEINSWFRDTVGDHTVFGIDAEDGLAACAWLDVEHHGNIAFDGDVRIRPGFDVALGDPLLDAIRTAAAGIEPAKPLHVFANIGADRQRAWLSSRGGVEARHFWRMAIDLDTRVAPAPALPEGVVLRGVADDEADLRVVFDIVDRSFRDHWGYVEGRRYDAWIGEMRKMSTLDLSLWWVAEVDGAPAAALLGWVMPDAEQSTCGHVGTLGTLAGFRGRGLGTLLLHTAFDEFAARGQRSATLGVDAANQTGAVHLYESVGMHPAHEWVLYELPPLASAGDAG